MHLGTNLLCEVLHVTSCPLCFAPTNFVWRTLEETSVSCSFTWIMWFGFHLDLSLKEELCCLEKLLENWKTEFGKWTTKAKPSIFLVTKYKEIHQKPFPGKGRAESTAIEKNQSAQRHTERWLNWETPIFLTLVSVWDQGNFRWCYSLCWYRNKQNLMKS